MDRLKPGSIWKDEHGLVEIESLDLQRQQVHFWRFGRKSFRVMEIRFFIKQFREQI